MGNGKKTPAAGEMLQGTLDMLILRTLVMGPAHGHTIAQVIEHTSEQALEVEQGSLYPALHRLEKQEWIESEWKVSENKQRVKEYKLTALGRKQLASERSRWKQVMEGMAGILDPTGEAGKA